MVDLRSIARPSTAKPSCALRAEGEELVAPETPVPAPFTPPKPAQLEKTAHKINRLLANPTPSRAPGIEKPVCRSLEGDFDSMEKHSGGSSLLMVDELQTTHRSLVEMTPAAALPKDYCRDAL